MFVIVEAKCLVHVVDIYLTNNVIIIQTDSAATVEIVVFQLCKFDISKFDFTLLLMHKCLFLIGWVIGPVKSSPK